MPLIALIKNIQDFLDQVMCEGREIINHITLTILPIPSANPQHGDTLSRVQVTGGGFRRDLAPAPPVWAREVSGVGAVAQTVESIRKEDLRAEHKHG